MREASSSKVRSKRITHAAAKYEFEHYSLAGESPPAVISDDTTNSKA